ncbi:hypothetical protein IQ06DRAFT_343737 [Phaeosphaeriaceae sp. SRC1lsM3a]|nr:hypothetical protein IQ06DRAFT_343737 [Stagonospora sp. SRC1lsM3a]
MTSATSNPRTADAVDPSTWLTDHIAATAPHPQYEIIARMFKRAQGEVTKELNKPIHPPPGRFLTSEREQVLKTMVAARSQLPIEEMDLGKVEPDSWALICIHECLLEKFVRQIGELVRRLFTCYVARVCEDDLENLFGGERRQAVEKIRNTHDRYKPDVAGLVELVKQFKRGYSEIKAWMFDAEC